MSRIDGIEQYFSDQKLSQTAISKSVANLQNGVDIDAYPIQHSKNKMHMLFSKRGRMHIRSGVLSLSTIKSGVLLNVTMKQVKDLYLDRLTVNDKDFNERHFLVITHKFTLPLKFSDAESKNDFVAAMLFWIKKAGQGVVLNGGTPSQCNTIGNDKHCVEQKSEMISPSAPIDNNDWAEQIKQKAHQKFQQNKEGLLQLKMQKIFEDIKTLIEGASSSGTKAVIVPCKNNFHSAIMSKIANLEFECHVWDPQYLEIILFKVDPSYHYEIQYEINDQDHQWASKIKSVSKKANDKQNATLLTEEATKYFDSEVKHEISVAATHGEMSTIISCPENFQTYTIRRLTEMRFKVNRTPNNNSTLEIDLHPHTQENKIYPQISTESTLEG